MNARKELIERAKAVAKASKELTERCEAAIAHIAEMDARQVESAKRQMAIIDAMFDAIEAVHKPKNHPTGIAFIEGLGIREMKP